MQIITNNQPRDLIYGFELTEKEKAQFDHLDFESEDGTGIWTQFFRYKGEVYNTSEFVRIECHAERTNYFTVAVDDNSPLLKWDGICSYSYLSGIVMKYADDGCGGIDYERVIIGRYYS